MMPKRTRAPVGAPPLVLLLATIGFGVTPATAQEPPAPEPVAEEVGRGHEGESEDAEHENALALFLGATVETADDETFFTIGLEYERELSHRWAVMAVAERVSDFDAWVLVAPVALKPFGGLSLMAGPGLETTPRRPEAHGAEHGGEPHEGESEEAGPFFLWRFGIGYTVPLGERFAVTPNVDLDLVREDSEWVEAWVVGVSVGIRF